MKRTILSNMMFLAVAVSMAFLPGCDEKKDDRGLLFAVLAGAGQTGPLTVKNVSPVSGTTGIVPSNSFRIIITFNRPTDGTCGTVSIHNKWQTPLLLVNGGNCTMTFNVNKTVLTIASTEGWYSGMIYEHITVSGFKDADGVVMGAYDDPDYYFVTYTHAMWVSTPGDGSTNVELDDVISIHFYGYLGPNKGSVTLDYDSPEYGQGSVTFTDPDNCTITFSDDAQGGNVTVTPTGGLYLNTTYSNISISGFRDPYGNTVEARTFPDYDFTTLDIN